MKEILQTKFLNLKSTFACASAHFCIIALHVENVYQEHVTVEAEAEESEELPQEFEVAVEVEEPVSEANFLNSESQQGKHRFIYPSILHKFKFMQAPVHITPCLT